MSYTRFVDLTIDWKEYTFQMEWKDWDYYSPEEHKKFEDIKTMKDLRNFLHDKFRENRCWSVLFWTIDEMVEDEIRDFLILK